MAARRGRVSVLGFLLLFAGGAVTAGAALGLPAFHAPFVGEPWRLREVVVAAPTAALGLILVVARFMRKPPEEFAVPAHVSFKRRVRHEIEAPVLTTPPGNAATGDPELVALDAAIRDVTRRIGKATVLLGTGQLSQDGYRRYVADLKRERGELEARKIRIELLRKRR